MNDTPETESSSIIAKLREYNLWRRGSNELAQPDSTEIGLCLDAVCDIAERRERERDEAREAFALAISNCVDAQQQLRTARHLADAAMWEADRLRSKLWRSRRGDSTLTESKHSY